MHTSHKREFSEESGHKEVQKNALYIAFRMPLYGLVTNEPS